MGNTTTRRQDKNQLQEALESHGSLQYFTSWRRTSLKQRNLDSDDATVRVYLMKQEIMKIERKKQDEIGAFDDAIAHLRREKMKFEVIFKKCELRLFTLLSELVLLEQFESKENLLSSKLEKSKGEKAQIVAEISEIQENLGTKKKEFEEWSNSTSSTPHPNFTALQKIFKKKIKRAKKKSAPNGAGKDGKDGGDAGGDGSDPSHESDAGADDDEDDDDDDDDDDDYDENDDDDDDEDDVCPPGCDLQLYEKVLAVCEKRADVDDAMADLTKARDERYVGDDTASSSPTHWGLHHDPECPSAAAAAAGKRSSEESSSFSRQKRQRTLSSSSERNETTTVLAPSEQDFHMAEPRDWEITEDDENGRKTRTSLPKGTIQHDSRMVSVENLPCPLNRDLLNESKLRLDVNDSPMIISAPDSEESRPTLRIPQRQSEAAELHLEQMDETRRAKKQRIDDFMRSLAKDEDRHGKEGGSRRHGIGEVHHSLPAVKLSLTTPELSKPRLRAFHRPRGKFKSNEQLQFAPPPCPALAKSAEITHIKKSSDLNPAAGGTLILLEYTEQNPPVLSNPGMAARLVHYWRPPVRDAESVGSEKKKSTPPKEKPTPPDMDLGQVITLGNRDDSPFIGDIPVGRVVTSLNSKLFKVPIFPHKAVPPFATKSEDRESGAYEVFLLCRPVSKSKKSGLSKSTAHLMELPQLFTAGQVEPQMEVPAPNSRLANDIIRPYMAFHILRLFKKANDGERLEIEDAARTFPSQSGTAIRKRMKEVAVFERNGDDDSGWWKKKPVSELATEEELRANIPPESVCLYESMMAGHRRLLDIGLAKLTTTAEVDRAISHLLKRLELRKQSLSAKMVDPLNLDRRAKAKAEEERWKSDPMIRKLETDIRVARYIEEQLQLTPWNLTKNYVECHLQGNGSGVLALSGAGDPTGRGEGFSFVRAPLSRDEGEIGANGNSPEAVAGVAGISADLRKLKMKEAGDVLRHIGFPDADIKNLHRWDRIHIIRELTLSCRAETHGAAYCLRGFVRDKPRTLSKQQQAYRKRCDEIYKGQIDALSSTKTQFSSDEEPGGDGEGDLDEWEKDIKASEVSSGAVLGKREDPGSQNGSPAPESEETPRRKVLKRTTRTIGEDGTETVTLEFILDETQIGRFKALHNSEPDEKGGV